MNKRTAKKVIEILLEADGGCRLCASQLLELFIRDFPDYESMARKLFRKRFDHEYDEW